MQTYDEIANLFNVSSPNRPHIAGSTVQLTVSGFERRWSEQDGQPHSAPNDKETLDVYCLLSEILKDMVGRLHCNWDNKFVTFLLTITTSAFTMRLGHELLEDILTEGWNSAIKRWLFMRIKYYSGLVSVINVHFN